MARKTRKISFVTPHSRLCVKLVFTIFQNYLFPAVLEEILLILCVVFAKSVYYGLDQVCWVIKYLRSKLPLAKPVQVEAKRGERGRAQGSTTTIADGSDREFAVDVARIAKEEKLPNNGLDGAAIGVKPRQNGDDHDDHVCVCSAP